MDFQRTVRVLTVSAAPADLAKNSIYTQKIISEESFLDGAAGLISERPANCTGGPMLS
jgi:hypothetical protein